MEDSEISILVEELLELEDVQNANKALAILIGVHPGLSYDINQYSVRSCYIDNLIRMWLYTTCTCILLCMHIYI